MSNETNKEQEIQSLPNKNTNQKKNAAPSGAQGQKRPSQPRRPKKPAQPKTAEKAAEGNKAQPAAQKNPPRQKKNTSGQKNAQNKAQGQEKPKETQKPKTQQKKREPSAQAKLAAAAKQSGRLVAAEEKAAKAKASQQRRGKRKQPVRIIPLGGLGEIGKNMTAYECGNDIFIVDCGMAFPQDDMLGVDLVLPDFTYVERNLDKIRGVVLTHGHEDHIGAVPYLLKKYDIPIYGTPLTIGLVEGKLKEHNLLGRAKLNVTRPGETVKMGCMSVEFIHVNHSIPDAVGFAIHTPAGVIVQTGDFKVDFSPIQGEIIDLGRFAQLGREGVLCLLSDSTNAERPGFTMSERKVGDSFETLFNNAENKRIIIASFSSNIHRIQQIVDNAVRYGRKVAVSGRSMVNVVTKAMELGYLKVPDGIMIDIDSVSRFPHNKVTIITTGSQGEPMSALSRMAAGEHRQLSITSDDFIIISASPIPGNEKHVGRVVNDLLKLGADVIYEKMYEVHVSGHACQEEQKLILSLTKPKFFLPVHGEFKHLKRHASLAQLVGVPEKNIHIGEIGEVIELDGVDMKVVGTVPAGQVLVDGYGVGDVGSIVLRDRKSLSEDGLMIVVMTIERESGAVVAGPDIVSRGFVYVREAEALMDEAKKVVKDVLNDCAQRNVREWGNIKSSVKDGLSSFIYRKTKRSPMILPVIMEI